MKVVIDRFEGDLAVCEKPDRSTVTIPRKELPEEAKEGDVLIIEGVPILLDKVETARRQQAARDLLNELWQ